MSGRRRSARRRADLSQHFLRSAHLARRLVAVSSISPDDLVVEAGPGRGTLTHALAERSRKVLAIELDRWFVAHLRSVTWPRGNVEVVGGDFLAYQLPPGPYKFFANIPFSRTADIVRKLAFSHRQPDDAYLIVQSEAATRFLGQPFGPDSTTSLIIKAQFDLSVLAWLNPVDFEPPSVNSVLLRLNRLETPRVPPSEMKEFRQFATATMQASGRPVVGHLRSHLTGPQLRGLVNDLHMPSSVAPSGASFEHWLTVFRLKKWNRP